jgi:hypothetical protein
MAVVLTEAMAIVIIMAVAMVSVTIMAVAKAKKMDIAAADEMPLLGLIRVRTCFVKERPGGYLCQGSVPYSREKNIAGFSISLLHLAYKPGRLAPCNLAAAKAGSDDPCASWHKALSFA